MLRYWILKRPDGKTAGLVRLSDDRVLLTLSAPIGGQFTLFSGTDLLPILPEREVRAPCAQALLGTEGDRVTCFAAAPDAKPLAYYREKLSRFYTKKEEAESESPDSPQPDPDLSQYNTIHVRISQDYAENDPSMSQINTIKEDEPDSIADTARDTEAFSLLLRRADAFFAAYEGTESPDNLVQKEDISVEAVGGIDLFSQEYPGARWRYIEGTDILPHYEGTWKQPNGQTLHILAVRGRAAPRPPRALLGFTRFLRDENGVGYWLRLTPLP